jgi:probable addiction module antidote protein
MAKKTITTPYDVAEHLRTPEERAGYLEAIIEEFDGDPRHVMQALGDIARSEGMTRVARKAKVSRESLYKSLSGTRKPEFATIFKVMTALGLQFQVVAR